MLRSGRRPLCRFPPSPCASSSSSSFERFEEIGPGLTLPAPHLFLFLPSSARLSRGINSCHAPHRPRARPETHGGTIRAGPAGGTEGRDRRKGRGECVRRGPASIILFLFPERLEFRTCLGDDHVSMGLSKMNSKAEKRHLKKTDHLEGKTFQG